MTTITITGTIAGAYKLNAPVTVLSIASTGYVEGNATYGVYSPASATGAYTILNDGAIKGGKYGVDLGGGTVTNGSASDVAATITGAVNGVRTHTKAATATNYGTIESTGVGYQTYGVYLGAGGLVTNGSATDSSATIYGYAAGVEAYASYGGHFSVANYGTIKSVHSGVFARASTQVNNFGTITSIGTNAFSRGISYGGRVVNGSSTDTTAMIEGYYAGVFSTESVVNYATIESHGTAASTSGVNFSTGGLLTNGSASDTTALISGATGVRTYGGAIDNFGTVVGKTGAGAYSALSFGSYTQIINGAAGDSSALIEGAGSGVRLPRGNIDNLGTIIGLGASLGTTVNAGVILGPALSPRGSRLENRGLIEGVSFGVVIDGTLTNYGTIEATVAGGYSVKLQGYSSLRVEPGSKLIGKVDGGGGTLDFASGKGVISKIGGGTIFAGSAEYLNFGTLTVGQGAAFTTTGVGTIVNGGVASLDIMGTLDVAGTLIVSGTLFNSNFYSAGHLAGAGHVDFLAGSSTITANTYGFGPGVQLTTAHVLIAGASTVVNVRENLTVSGAVVQTGGTVNVASTRQLSLTGAGDKLSGTLTGAGTVALSGAGDTLSGLTLSVSRTVINAASANLSGVIGIASILSVTSPSVRVSGLTQFTGGGIIQLAQFATNEIIGASATAQLQNSDIIEGGGQLGGGQLRLTNQAAGTIIGFGAVGLVINTGTQVVANAGLIEAVGAGGLVIDGAVANTGMLEARGGNLTVDGAVTGAGKVSIYGGTASFAGAFSENVAFTLRGELALAQSQAYSGTISGFSKSGATSLDLEDVSFTGASAIYSGTTTSGVLIVADGTHTARINFAGNYLASTWALSSDGHGGVTVTDPPAAAHLLTSAIAGFAPAAMSASASQPAGGGPHPLLASPGG